MSGVDKAATESEGISNVPLRNPFFSGGRFLCWWRKAKRHRNHHKETQDFSQVMAVFHKLTVVASPLCDVCVMRLRVLLRVAAAVMTSVGGVCLTCCLLSCPRTSSAEERLLRLSCLHERPHVFTLLVSLTLFFFLLLRFLRRCCSACHSPCSGLSTKAVNFWPAEWVTWPGVKT